MGAVVGIHQPNYLPWLGYIYKIIKSDIFVVLDNVQYSKNSFQNRVKIKTANGAAWLTIPISHDHGQLTRDVKISAGSKWRSKHLKTIELNYKRSPYFKECFEVISKVYERDDWVFLADFNVELLREIMSYLHISKELVFASDLQTSGASTDLLVEILKAVGGSVYLSGAGAEKYQEQSKFDSAGIALKYAGFSHPVYGQQWGEFIPGLSIIDLMFNCGRESVNVLATDSKSIK